MNRLGRAMVDPTRSGVLLTRLSGPQHPAALAKHHELRRSTVSNHVACLRDCGIVVALHQRRQTRYDLAGPHLTRALTALVDTTLAVEEDAPYIDSACTISDCANTTEVRA